MSPKRLKSSGVKRKSPVPNVVDIVAEFLGHKGKRSTLKKSGRKRAGKKPRK